MGAFEEEALLRIHEGRVRVAVTEERGVEVIRVVEHALGRDELRPPDAPRIRAGRDQCLGVEPADGLVSASDHLPEIVRMTDPRGANGHSDDRNGLGALRRLRGGLARRGVVATREPRQGGKMTGEESNRRQAHQGHDVDVHAELFREGRLHTREGEGMAADLEERRVEVDLGNAQHITPDGRDACFQVGGGHARRGRG